MKASIFAGKMVRYAAVPVLAMAVGMASAQRPQDQRNDHNQDPWHNNQGHDDHNQGHDNWHNDRNQGNDFHFGDQERGQFQQHYNRDAHRWHGHHGRPEFVRGQRVPDNYHFQPVPRSYYRTPPPPGYQYGYYQGYVVAYDPATRIIADVLDLAAAASH